LKLNRAHQLLFYVDDVNILGRSVHSIRKRAEATVIASKKMGLELNADKISTWSCHEIRVQNEVTI